MQIRVYYEDTDAGGVVYYANYLKFCERARSELFFQANLSPHKETEFFVVKNLNANYIYPARFGDLLDLKLEVISIKSASIILKQSVINDDKLLFWMDVTLVYVKDFKPSKIPLEYLELFK